MRTIARGLTALVLALPLVFGLSGFASAEAFAWEGAGVPGVTAQNGGQCGWDESGQTLDCQPGPHHHHHHHHHHNHH